MEIFITHACEKKLRAASAGMETARYKAIANWKIANFKLSKDYEKYHATLWNLYQFAICNSQFEIILFLGSFGDNSEYWELLHMGPAVK